MTEQVPAVPRHPSGSATTALDMADTLVPPVPVLADNTSLTGAIGSVPPVQAIVPSHVLNAVVTEPID